jgi:hypothetical protein
MPETITDFVLEEKNGIKVLIKLTLDKNTKEVLHKETWGDMEDFDDLFQACFDRWESNWDLNKVMTAIRECDFD